MQVQIQIKTVYGNVTYYPVNEAAKRFAAIAGTKTLSVATIRNIQALGFAVEYVDALAFVRV